MTTASQPDPHSGFGEAFVTYYAHIKEAEIARFRKAAAGTSEEVEVTEWEHREYFDML
jgi:glutamine synthetase